MCADARQTETLRFKFCCMQNGDFIWETTRIERKRIRWLSVLFKILFDMLLLLYFVGELYTIYIV